MEGNSEARLSVVVRGWVQGIGYRDFVSRVAVFHRLKGYVRNSSDGSVEIEAEGFRDELQRFLDRLKSGHPLAEVEHVEVAWDTYRGEFADWDLRW